MSEECGNDFLSDINVEQIREELFEKRKILLNEPISEHILYSLWHPIEKLKQLDNKPITLYINSPGGDAYASLLLASSILSSKIPIYTVAMGLCFSGAAIIAVSGHKKFCYKYTTFMWHLPKSSSDEVTTSRNLESQAKGIQMLDADIFDLLLTKTKLNKRIIKKKLEVDWFFGPDEALKYGIVDEVI